MRQGFGRNVIRAPALCLVLGVSCGRTASDTSAVPDATGAHAGASTSAAMGGDTDTNGKADVANALTGAAGGVGGDASAISEAGAPEPAMLLFHGVVSRVGVVSDQDGNALVQWDAGRGQVDFARWNAAQQKWLYPAPVVLDTAFVVDTYRSGHPILIGDELDPASGVSTTVVRRFDAQANAWGPAQPTGIGGSSFYGLHLSMDGAGNVYAFWLGADRVTEAWTWWPVDRAAWEPIKTIDHASGVVGDRHGGAWLWQESSGFGVRAFDLAAGNWSDDYQLQPLGSSLGVHQLVVGPSGEALAATLRHDPMQLVMLVWRFDPQLAAWGPPETALQVATDGDPKQTYSPRLPITDLVHHDIVALSVPEGDQFELLMNRRDPSTGSWSSLHTFAGLATSTQIELTGDESGNLYGEAPPAGLFQYSAATGVWTETPVDGGEFKIVVSRTGAFALGWNSATELVAYRHPDANGAWRQARGMPTDAIPEIGSVPFAIAPLGQDRALVVWPTRAGGSSGGLRAAFIE